MVESLKISGVGSILAAIEEGRPVTRILVLRGAQSDALDGLLVEASKRKLKVIEGSMNDLRRMANMPFNSDPPEALGLLDRDPSASIDEIMASGGLIWLLAGAQYPVNIGFAIRTIEVSGGSAVFVDADLNSDGRKASSRASMKADRFIPVKWISWREASDLARAHNYRIIGIEDSGDVEPWDADLKGRCMLVIGGERHGISADLLQECDSIVKIPMRGFVPSYNLQAPLAVVAAEALRAALRVKGEVLSRLDVHQLDGLAVGERRAALLLVARRVRLALHLDRLQQLVVRLALLGLLEQSLLRAARHERLGDAAHGRVRHRAGDALDGARDGRLRDQRVPRVRRLLRHVGLH